MHGLLAGGNGQALLTQHTQHVFCWTAWLASHHLTCFMHLRRLTWGPKPAVWSRYAQLLLFWLATVRYFFVFASLSSFLLQSFYITLRTFSVLHAPVNRCV